MTISEPKLRALTPLQRTQWVRDPAVTGIDPRLASKVCPSCGLFQDEWQHVGSNDHICAPEQDHQKAKRYGTTLALCKNREIGVVLQESSAMNIAEVNAYLATADARATLLRIVRRGAEDSIIVPLRVLP